MPDHTVPTPFLDYALTHGFGDLHMKVDPKTGFKAIIAIHNTKRGPALGGCRFIEYPNTEAAILDAMRLAMGMSYKSALAGLPLGGGKGVIIKPHGSYDREAYLRSFGEFIHELGGRYITAVDSGTDLCDMDIIVEQTPYVASLSIHHDSPSPHTAQGVLQGIKAALTFKRGHADLAGVHVAIQGLGHVGFLLAQYLHEHGATLTVSDIDHIQVEKAVRLFSATAVSPEEIHKTACDIFAPCALGGILTEANIEALNTDVIAGAANNQLEHAKNGQLLYDKGILYAPDYVINAGGIIFAASKYLGSNETAVQKQLEGIYDTLLTIFNRSKKEHKPTNVITDTLARELLS